MSNYNASFFEGKYYGQSLCQDGNTQQRANVATHAVRSALEEGLKRPKLSVVTTTYGLTLLDPTAPGADAKVYAYVPLRDLACITLHDKNGKRRMLALLIRRRDKDGNQLQDNKLDCHVFTLNTQSIARRFYDHVRKICQEAAIHRKLDAQRVAKEQTPAKSKMSVPSTPSSRPVTPNSMQAASIPAAFTPKSPSVDRPRPVINAWG